MISFICLPDRSSGEIRAKQISEFIEGSEVLNISHRQIPKNKFVIFVRQFDLSYCKELHRQGFVIGRDIADVPAWDFLLDRGNTLKDYILPECSFYIVNNTWYKKQIEECGAKNVFVIPHHSCNFEELRTCTGSKIETVGYLGLPEQLSRSREIEDYCKTIGLKFVSADPKTRKDLVEKISQIDLGIIFLDSSTISSEKIEYTKKFKPNTKLTNFQSYGIPSICIDYESFKEFGGGAYLSVARYEDAIGWIGSLIRDEKLRRSLSESGIEVSKPLSIRSISESYRRLLGEI